MQKKIILWNCAIVLAVIGVGYFVSAKKFPAVTSSNTSTSSVVQNTPSHGPCLADNEYADFPLSEKKRIAFNTPTSSTIDVYVADKGTNKTIFTFQIKDINSSFYPIQFSTCGVYVLREFGQDTQHSFPVGYHVDLWKYDYSGNGTKLFTMFEEIGTNYKTFNYYSPAFLIDPTSHYLALDRGYQQSNEALVVKDLASLKDLFSLPLSELANQVPNVVGFFDFVNGGWSKDGRYIWYDFDDPADPADVIGFVRVDTNDWSYELFEAPLVTMGGDAFNPDTGMTTYSTNVAPWTGDALTDQQYRDEAIRSGQVTSFYIYNLLTKKNYLVATTTDPTYYFQPQWLSDSLLQYIPASGVTSTFTVPGN